MAKYGGLGKKNYMAIDDAVDSWAKGRLTNSDLRKTIKSLGGRLENKSLGPNDSTDTIRIDFPDGTGQDGWNEGGQVKTISSGGRFKGTI